MGQLKPLGSEKLQGDEKLRRILELTYHNTPKNKSIQTYELIESIGHQVFGIVKEKDGYYVKQGLNEQTLDYIGGMFMKNKNRFGSYSEALKRLELLKCNENLSESTKYILKPNNPQAIETSLPAEPQMNLPPLPDESLPAPEIQDELPTGDAPSSKPSDYMAEIQKFAGKLGQELRDQRERLQSDDIKYTLNMIIGAVDLGKLEDDDIEDIASKFERDDESGDVPLEVPSEDDPAPSTDDNQEEIEENMNKLEEFIETDFNFENDDETYKFDEDELEFNESDDSVDTDSEQNDYFFDSFDKELFETDDETDISKITNDLEQIYNKLKKYSEK
jgi:hypothetical protein